MDIPTASIIMNIIMSVATAFMAIATMKSVKEMNLSRKETNRAYLVLYFKIVNSEIYLILKNFGSTAAHNIKIEPTDEEKQNKDLHQYLNRKIDIIAPDSEINIHLDQENYNTELPKLSLNLIYKDIYKETHSEKYDLDISYVEDENVSLNSITPFLDLIKDRAKGKEEKIQQRLSDR